MRERWGWGLEEPLCLLGCGKQGPLCHHDEAEVPAACLPACCENRAQGSSVDVYSVRNWSILPIIKLSPERAGGGESEEKAGENLPSSPTKTIVYPQHYLLHPSLQRRPQGTLIHHLQTL